MSMSSLHKIQVCVKGSRVLLQVALIFIFLHFFGVPAIKRFLAREVMVVNTLRNSGGKIAAPSITINARNPKTLRGWQGDERDSEKYLLACLQRSDSEACVDNGTYSQSDVLDDVLLGYKKTLSLMNMTNLWRKDYLREALKNVFFLTYLFGLAPF